MAQSPVASDGGSEQRKPHLGDKLQRLGALAREDVEAVEVLVDDALARREAEARRALQDAWRRGHKA